MVLQPKPADYPRIRRALKIYRVTSIITGIMLLLLLAEMILKYSPTHVELFAGGSGGGAWFAPVAVGEGCQWYSMFFPWQEACEMTSTGDGTNISLLILIAHGWFYVAYLVSCFMVWSPMRWRFTRFLLLALGGVVPLLSFFMEVRVHREVTAFLGAKELDAAEPPVAPVVNGG
ncbi:DUF3817 domain-containing protein [Leucobacter weissii]|uniref:DUF3817 domain-containing protein n=1 Tax=Leucobacter weissii TaxID=1983706 RepID=A0A939MSH9_9MICO|nr:DUF3817 domain-containing protein [Leucobacter weissii]MBO1902194.1 DUF3817 domain-containing protein [Leucobacter weissii]